MYAIKGRQACRNPDRQTLLLPPSAMLSLERLLASDQPQFDRLQNPDSEVLLQFYPSAADPTLPAEWELVREAERPQGGAAVTGGAPYLIARLVQPRPPLRLPLPGREGLQKFQPWDQVVRPLSLAEQLILLRQAFGSAFITEALAGTMYQRRYESW